MAMTRTYLAELPPGPYILDTWRGNGRLDAEKLAGAGVTEVLVRAGEGYSMDPLFRRNYWRLLKEGTRTGAWWVLYPNLDAKLQALYFADALDGTGYAPWDGSLWFDCQRPTKPGPRLVDQFVGPVLYYFHTDTGFNAGIYTGAWWWDPASRLCVSGWKSVPLWIADWRKGATSPLLPKSWAGVTPVLWQYASIRLPFPGLVGEFDLNRRLKETTP